MDGSEPKLDHLGINSSNSNRKGLPSRKNTLSGFIQEAEVHEEESKCFTNEIKERRTEHLSRIKEFCRNITNSNVYEDYSDKVG